MEFILGTTDTATSSSTNRFGLSRDPGLILLVRLMSKLSARKKGGVGACRGDLGWLRLVPSWTRKWLWNRCEHFSLLHHSQRDPVIMQRQLKPKPKKQQKTSSFQIPNMKSRQVKMSTYAVVPKISSLYEQHDQSTRSIYQMVSCLLMRAREDATSRFTTMWAKACAHCPCKETRMQHTQDALRRWNQNWLNHNHTLVMS